MKIDIEYTANYEAEQLKMKTAHGAEIVLSFSGEDFSYLTIDQLHELESSDEALNALFIGIEKAPLDIQVISLNDLVRDATEAWIEFMNAASAEHKRESAHAASLRSLSATGRI